jgi:hypothetical protein
MAKVILANVKVDGVFWDGKGARVLETLTVNGSDFYQRFSIFFDAPHNLNEGDVLNLEGQLGAKPSTYVKQDGTQGLSANLTVNYPVMLAEPVRAAQADQWVTETPQKTQEAAIMEQWPTAVIGQATALSDPPF